MDGRLAQHFSGLGFKRLTAVECITMGVSNQHEIGSSTRMRDFLGTERHTFDCDYLYLADSFAETGEIIEDQSSWITYYDAREHQPHRSAEYRLTYPAGNPVMTEARAGDYCWLTQLADDPNHLMVVVAEGQSAIGRQLDRLFGTGMRHAETAGASGVLKAADLSHAKDDDLSIEDADLLMLLGVPMVPTSDNLLDLVIARFGDAMPKVKPFCEFIREICPSVDPTTDIDMALHQWYVLTTEMFFGLERHVVQPVLDENFANKPSIDIDTFFKTAMKYQQSRYSRAGNSWENHLMAAFLREGVAVTHNTAKLADGTKPDFLFPSRQLHEAGTAPRELLTFVGAKTSTKERWMQLVAEGRSTDDRHLATLDRDLNHEVLAAMAVQNVIPVLPATLIAESYGSMPSGMMTFAELITLVRDREDRLVQIGSFTR